MKTIPLFKQFPNLESSLSLYPLGNFPTPVYHAIKIGNKLNNKNIYIKRDDLSGTLYGGNKVRKLEFIFGEAVKKKSIRLITSGAAGSNHALAVAVYGKAADFKVTLMLTEQPYNSSISANLLADYYSGAEMILSKSYEEHAIALEHSIQKFKKIDNYAPYVIPPGGSSAIGAVGYVNAAFELLEQIRNGEIPQPQTIYLPLGTMGTACGLLLGLKAAKINCRLIGVAVVPSYIANREKFRCLFDSTNKLLHDFDNTFPICDFSENDFFIDTDQFGEGYGIITPESNRSIDIVSQTEQINLDGVYSGKAFSAIVKNTFESASSKETVLFWNTKSSLPLPAESQKIDYQQLPSAFHHYFQNQPNI